ncbi:MAG: AMP-binding protein [Burkholderiaceae bacterium]
MTHATTIRALLDAGADADTALSAPGGVPLSFGALRTLVDDTVAALNAAGIGRNDRVAIVLPNGPEMATAFLAVAGGATSAPLNPSYRADEFEFYLSDLGAKGLVVAAGSDSPAIEVARRLGIRLIELQPQAQVGAGAFRLAPEGEALACAEPGPARPDDVALVLHTSGTTSRPKIVPLSQRNVCASARNIREFLSLSGNDRGLNIMPLFHIHGLIAGITAPLSAGGQVCCTPGFNALRFFAWMDEAHPTWYTAVPTMHQAILSRAANNRAVIEANPLRFIRSSSSAMPTQVIHEIEDTFGAPLVESYGMTEAAHQMAANPLPPRERKPGTVGVAAGPGSPSWTRPARCSRPV